MAAAREVARHDYDRLLIVLNWPLRELLIAYVETLRSAALESFRYDMVLYWLQAPHLKKPRQPPKVPSILK
jgi:hypothetical protein